MTQTAMQLAMAKALRDPKKREQFVKQEVREEGEEMDKYHPGIVNKTKGFRANKNSMPGTGSRRHDESRK